MVERVMGLVLIAFYFSSDLEEINDGLLLEQGVLEAQRKNMAGNSVLYKFSLPRLSHVYSYLLPLVKEPPLPRTLNVMVLSFLSQQTKTK